MKTLRSKHKYKAWLIITAGPSWHGVGVNVGGLVSESDRWWATQTDRTTRSADRTTERASCLTLCYKILKAQIQKDLLGNMNSQCWVKNPNQWTHRFKEWKCTWFSNSIFLDRVQWWCLIFCIQLTHYHLKIIFRMPHKPLKSSEVITR